MHPGMRRTILVATLAALGGFCLASATAFGAARYHVWRAYGANFQLGYVVGYLDALGLARRQDARTMIPTSAGKNFERWVREVNEFYENPANDKREVADAMFEVGSRIQAELLKGLADSTRRSKPEPSPSAEP
jgi:hypothetical protein